MYANLLESLKRKGISLIAAAAAVDMPEAIFKEKALNGGSFFIEEAFTLKRKLFPEPETSIAYLFERTDSKEAE